MPSRVTTLSSVIPSPNAAAAYDTARIIDAAATAIGGKIEDKAAFQKAMENVKFTSLRGNFKFNANHYPIQDYYLREVGKDAEGRITNKLVGTTLEKHQDAYVGACKM